MTINQPRRGPGAPLGNQNALRHGRRSAQAVLSRKLGRARLKALAHMGLATGMFYKGCLPNPRFNRRAHRLIVGQLAALLHMKKAVAGSSGHMGNVGSYV